jgi:tRNA(Ile2) C34 agmatinyltransferase TiaS
MMTGPVHEKFVKEVINVIDRWSFEQCAFCENGTMISIEGMLDFKCSKCGKPMNTLTYIGEIAKTVFKYRDQLELKADEKKTNIR